MSVPVTFVFVIFRTLIVAVEVVPLSARVTGPTPPHPGPGPAVTGSPVKLQQTWATFSLL